MPSIEHIQEVLSEIDCTLLSEEFISRRSKLEVRCKQNHTYYPTWEAIKNGRRCPKCQIPAAITVEKARDVAKKRGYKLLSNEINGNKDLLEWECQKGHSFEKTWKDFSRVKTGCPRPECNPTAIRSHESVLEEFSKEGYTLLSKYQSNPIDMKVRCPEGHLFRTSRSRFVNQNQRCPYCCGGIKLRSNEALERIKANGFSLVSGEFNGVSEALTVRCKRGHVFERTIQHISQQCPICYSDSLKYNTDKLREIAIKDGYNVLSEYVDSKTPLLFECNGISPSGIVYPEKHRYEATWQTFASGKRCEKCNKNKKTVEFIQEFVKERGLTLLSTEYVDSKTHLEFECSLKKHRFKKTWNSIQQESGCPRCQNNSYGEEGIIKFLEHYGFSYLLHDRKILEGKELDIVVPDHQLAIEFCGLYYHSREMLLTRVDKLKRIPENEKAKRRKKINRYHRDKLDLCQEKGYRLLTIFSDEWNLKKPIVLDRIFSTLGKSEKLHARKCTVDVASKEEAHEFLNRHHLQGSSPRRYSFKLVHSGETVGILTLGKPNRAHVSKGLEIKRLAFKTGVQIRGGASKLFSFALKNIEKTPEIISFCDLRYGNGKVYEALGFALEGISEPSPHLTDGTTRKSYQSIAGRKMTDRWLKIYDCGHQKWVYRF